MTLVHDHTRLDANRNADLDREAAMVARAAACAPTLARNAAQHDQDGSWVQESFDEIRRAGPLRIAVPTELGGDGATIREVAMDQRELAKSCGSTALASAMHQHVTAFTAWRCRRGLPGAEATLRRIAQEGIAVASTGGGDYTEPNGVATKVEGGFRVSGRKSFVSRAPAGTVISTMFRYEDSADRPAPRRLVAALAALAVATTGGLVNAGTPLVMAKLATNHNEAAAADRSGVPARPGRRRIRQALVALTVVATPVAVSATPVGAAGTDCPPWMCGKDGNHNETATRDRRP